jgi:prepilin-type N-terminal cleavage/methylation domain-containing protein
MKLERETGNGECRKERIRRGRVSAFRVPTSAFTLVEVVAALAILALISGSVYALLRQSFQAAAGLQQAEREDQALRRFLDICRTTLDTLPPDATLSLATADKTGTAQELTISGVPEAFAAGPDPIFSSDLILGLRMAKSSVTSSVTTPMYEVAISREEFAPKAKSGEFQIRASSNDDFYQPDDQGRYWLPLLSSIRSLEWRYWSEQDRLWQDDWTKAPDRPTLLEMQLWPESRSSPLRAVFAIPAAPKSTAGSTDQASAGLGTGDASGKQNAGGAPPRGDRGNAQQGQGPGNGKPGDSSKRSSGRGRGGRPGEGERNRGSPNNRSPRPSSPNNRGNPAPQPGRPNSAPSAPRAPGAAPSAPVAPSR